MSGTSSATILIVEDGDEYFETLTRFVPGPKYLQAHSGEEALGLLKSHDVDALYLDLRFDRIPREQLVGDFDAARADHAGDLEAAWRHLEENQGLYILALLSDRLTVPNPVFVAHDFSGEPRRWKNLGRLYPNLVAVPDVTDGAHVRSLFAELAPGDQD